MKSKLLFIAITFFSTVLLQAQVGVGNTNPQATLDISATSTTSPADNDGILIPRMSNFPSTPGATRDGILIFYTGTGASGKGFYYWDSGTSLWEPVKGAERINDLLDGKTDTGTYAIYLGNNSGTNDDGSNNTNIGIGRSSLNSVIDNSNNIAIGYTTMEDYLGNAVPGNNVAVGNNNMKNMTTGALNTAIGHGAMENINFNTNSNVAIGTYALRNLVSGTNNTVLGYSAGNGSDGSNNVLLGNSSGSDINGSGNVFIGYRSAANLSTGSNLLYIENSDEINTPLVYGEFDNDIFRINGEVQVGNPGGNGYAFPLIDGTNNQILRTNGSGQLSFVNPSSIFTDSDEQTIDNFSFNTSTNILTLEIGNDGIPAQTVNLSSLSTSDADWHEVGTTTSPNSINDNIFTQGRVGIGDITPDASLKVEYSGADTKAAIIDFTTTSSAVSPTPSAIPSGLTVNTTASSTNRQLTSGLFTISGTMSTAQSDSAGMAIANSAVSQNQTNGLVINVDGESDASYGIYNDVISSPSNSNFGIYNNVNGASIANIGGSFNASGISTNNYGIYSSASGATTNWAGYFGGGGSGSGNVYIQDNLEIDGSLNYTDGNEAAGFILGSNATGDANWVDPSTLFVDEIDWYEENTTTKPNAITDDIYTNGHVGIGVSNVVDPLQVLTLTNDTTASFKNESDLGSIKGILNDLDGTSTTPNLGFSSGLVNRISRTNQSFVTGVSNSFTNTVATFSGGQIQGYSNFFGNSISNVSIGLFNRFQGTTQEAYGVRNLVSGSFTDLKGMSNYNIPTDNLPSVFYGLHNTFSGSSEGDRYGVYTSFAETGNGLKYGEYIEIPTTAGGVHYGIYADVQKTTGYAAYFLGRTSFGTGATNRYLLPPIDGANGQVITTDGFGNLSFQNPNTGTDNQNIQNLAFNTSTNILTVGIENGTSQTVNLSTLNIDDQNIQNLAFDTTTNILTVGIENGTSQTVDLSILDTGGDIAGVSAGDGLTGDSASGNVSLDVVANNGITAYINDIRLGGALTQATTIAQGNNDMVFNLNGTGDFRINDNGTSKLVVLDNGDTVLGGDFYMRNENTGGTLLARITDINGDDGALDLYNSDVLTTRINGGGDSYLNAGSLGIGTTTPDYNLSVSGTLNLREDIAAAGTALRVNGTEALWFDGNLFSWGFGGTANFFSDDVGIGTNAPAYKLDVRNANAGDYVAQIYNTSTNANVDGLKIRVGNANPVSSSSFIAFFDGGNAVRGRIEGNGTGVTYNTISDRRLKTNISNINNALNLIDKIQPRRYEYKTKLGTQEFGFIAQELQPLYPQAVTGTPDSDVTTNPMMVDYSRLSPLLTAGIKELKDEVDQLKTENESLRAKLQKLEMIESRLTALENKSETKKENALANANN